MLLLASLLFELQRISARLLLDSELLSTLAIDPLGFLAALQFAQVALVLLEPRTSLRLLLARALFVFASLLLQAFVLFLLLSLALGFALLAREFVSLVLRALRQRRLLAFSL